MRNYLYALCCLICFSCGQPQQTQEQTTAPIDSATVPKQTAIVATVSADTAPSTVEQIRQRYITIQNKLSRGQLDSTAVKYDCNQERSGTVTYFSDHGKLVLIKHRYNEYSHFSATDHYYVNKDSLYFAYLNSTSWSFESGKAAEGATQDNITEQRIYLAKAKPLLWLQKKYVTHSPSTSQTQSAAQPNKKLNNKPVAPVLKDFNRLMHFKDSAEHDCLP
jgi:hypothetical protein